MVTICKLLERYVAKSEILDYPSITDTQCQILA